MYVSNYFPHSSFIHANVRYIVFDDFKLKSERQRDPDERLQFAKFAVDVAKISKSLTLFKEVAEWARRFIRDIVSLNIPNTFCIELICTVC
jgi:hypothetical protein